MPCTWKRSYLENVMAVSACNYLTAGISGNPAITKDHQHMLFDLSWTERFQCFSVFLHQNYLDQLQGEKKGPTSICEAWIYRMNSPYKCYTVNCRRDLERLPGWLLTFPRSSLAIFANPSHFPVRIITVRYKISVCLSLLLQNSHRIQNTNNKICKQAAFSRNMQVCWFHGESNVYGT